MTLSLDDVRNKRFRMARKGGYEVLEVDEFVDEVEESFAQLFEENASLKKQVDALRSGSSDQGADAALGLQALQRADRRPPGGGDGPARRGSGGGGRVLGLGPVGAALGVDADVSFGTHDSVSRFTRALPSESGPRP